MEVKKFQEILGQRRTELEIAIRIRKPDITAEQVSDALDKITYDSNMLVGIGCLDNDSAELAQVRQALKRIEEGTFGVCVVCDDEIAPKRLKALPWAAKCIGCQQKEEKQPRHPEMFGLVSVSEAA